MKLVAKWGMYVLAGLAALIVVLAIATYGISSWKMQATYLVEVEPVPVSADSAVLARGRHIAQIRGCYDCHGEQFQGRVFIDQAPVGVFAGPNLTGGEGSPVREFSNKDWVRAIRHGVGADGKPLLFMPSYEYFQLSDQDLGALISYLQNMPEINNDVKKSSVGPLGRALYLAGDFPLIPAEVIDHQARRSATPAKAPTADYGAYIATSCSGCHGKGYSGGRIPGTPPDWLPAANITPDAKTGIGMWSFEDFEHALREGLRPDGSQINSQFMPIAQTKHLTDVELKALWAYLQTLPAKEQGNR